jgi:putative ABC transport system permease protein
MNLATLAVKNVSRHKGRTALTALGIAVAIVLFTLMRVFVLSWTGSVDDAASDRLGTRHKVTFIMTLPKRYAEDIAAMPGVAKVNGVPQVSYMNWFGGKVESRPNDFFATIATDPPTFLQVYNEILVDKAQAEAWKQNRQGALVGDQLAKLMGWKVGDKVTLTSPLYAGNWDFTIEGIYTAERRTVDRSSFWFHWAYLNDSTANRIKDQIGWIVTRVDQPGASARLAKQIDAMFEERDVQTLTMSEKAMNQSFLGMFSAILDIITFVTIAILAIIVLILGNTIGMAVRERTHEYGCLRAIGFRSGHIAAFVVGESLTIAFLGGLLGLLIAQAFINGFLGPAVEQMMGAMFPHFRIPAELALTSLAIAASIAVGAAGIPARRVSKLKVAESLRAVE